MMWPQWGHNPQAENHWARDDSATESPSCPSGGLGFKPLHPHENLQLSLIPVPGEPKYYLNCWRHCMYMVLIHADRNPAHKIKSNKKCQIQYSFTPKIWGFKFEYHQHSLITSSVFCTWNAWNKNYFRFQNFSEYKIMVQTLLAVYAICKKKKKLKLGVGDRCWRNDSVVEH